MDHSALVYILSAEREPSTVRPKKLNEDVSNYTFKIKFMRGKDMIVLDSLSMHPSHALTCPYEIIPISYEIKDLLGNL